MSPAPILIFWESEVYNMTYSENKKAYNQNYAKEKLKRIPLDVPKEKYDEIKAHSDKMHESVNGFIKRAIDETMERDTPPEK